MLDSVLIVCEVSRLDNNSLIQLGGGAEQSYSGVTHFDDLEDNILTKTILTRKEKAVVQSILENGWMIIWKKLSLL